MLPDMWINIVDLEATCWEKGAPGGVQEIIEIGLTELNLISGERRRAPRMLVRPTRAALSPFCTALTGITPEQVGAAPTFDVAAATLREHHDAGQRPWASWGDFDRRLLAQQTRELSLPVTFGSRHLNLKAHYAAQSGLSRPVGMIGALQREGLAHTGLHHQGDDDSWNIAAIAARMIRRGWLDATSFPAQ